MEIGSILEFDDKELYADVPSAAYTTLSFPFMNGKEYKLNLYQNARNASEALYLFLKKSVSCVIMPDYVCSTVPDAAKRAGLLVKTYHIGEGFSFDVKEINNLMEFSAENGKLPILYLIHYNGIPLASSLVSLAKEWMEKGYIVLEDITMSIFSKDDGNLGFGSYIIGSLRKWLPIPDGGFVCSAGMPLPKMPASGEMSKYCYFSSLAQELKRDYIRGGEIDKGLKDVYMGHYRTSIDYLFSDYSIHPVSSITKNYLSHYSQESIIHTRSENYRYFYEIVKKYAFLKPVADSSFNYLPFGMVVLTDKRDELLSFLVSNDVYCNVHWRLDGEYLGEEARKLSNTIMTIPCDQRYGKEDFDRIDSLLSIYSERL